VNEVPDQDDLVWVDFNPQAGREREPCRAIVEVRSRGTRVAMRGRSIDQ
jgi:hypothetical protein